MVPSSPGSSQCQELVVQVLPHPSLVSESLRGGIQVRSGNNTLLLLNLKRTPLVGGHDRCLLCPVVNGALCLQMLDNHLLIPWGLGAAVFSLPVLPPTRTRPRWGNIETRTGRTWVRL